jgi:hypothetical protein
MDYSIVTYCKKELPLEIVETQPKYSKVVYSSQEFSTLCKIAIIKLPFHETVLNTAWWLAFHGDYPDNLLQSQGNSLVGKRGIKGDFVFSFTSFGQNPYLENI